MQKVIVALVFFLALPFLSMVSAQHVPNGSYSGANLNRVAFPIGGMGTGMFCLEGTGAISHLSVQNFMNFFNEPACFAAVCVLGDTPEQNVARVVEGPSPDWKYFGKPGSGNGSGGTTYGLPRFKNCTFHARFPFCTVSLAPDAKMPLKAEITGWSPFTPGDADSSSMPIGALEYAFTNPTTQPINAVFTFNSPNIIDRNGSIGPMEDGFVLYRSADASDRETKGALAFAVDKSASGLEKVIIDYCWFRGGWWDALTIAWDNVEKGRVIESASTSSRAPGATLAAPFTLKPGETKTIRLLVAWYSPETTLTSGRRIGDSRSPFEMGPASGTAQGQQQVTGFLGRKLVNTFYPGGDAATGTLVSPEIPLTKKFVHFLIGGGSECSFQLFVDDERVRSASGRDQEQLNWETFDTAEFVGKQGVFKIVDNQSGGWGHINIDHIIQSDEPINALKSDTSNYIATDTSRFVLIDDFERDSFAPWKAEVKPAEVAAEGGTTECCPGGVCDTTGLLVPQHELPNAYIPWYSTKFKSVHEVAKFWKENYSIFRLRSEKFRDAFYDSTLPPEVVEAVAANLTILKSPTVLRQHDGRLWVYEGCNDGSGCCDGSCTHVWNYAQAIPHLFPELERGLRQTEFFEGMDATGRQAFRVNMPIAEGGNMFDASDGQLGGIIKVYRDWRIFGNNDWIKMYWSRVQPALNYAIEKYDPRHTGLLEEQHHNTYDIDYFGPDGHCGSFYLAALAAAVEMGKALGDKGENVKLYEKLLKAGAERMQKELYNGEYFIQIVQKEGLARNFNPLNPNDQSVGGYREIARLVNEQGPKYQYGTGCLSDGVLGFWMAETAGINASTILPQEKIKSHLLSVYNYNMRKDLTEHSNPQRPSYAMGNDGGLLLCSWPHGGKPLIPFVYSDEIWTGIEYQVASHLMMSGEVAKGLDIVQTLRKRHDGVRRNPFNEYECGHWYARALASYGLLQGLTGARYDAVTKTLYVDSRVGDFRSFLSTNSGFGTVIYKDGKVTLDVKSGTIPMERVVVRATSTRAGGMIRR